jgi:ATP-dependent helicase/nuclease subunit B
MSDSASAKVFSIDPGRSFVDALAAGILAETGDDATALARVTVLLPTRRACRALREAFLRRSGGRPLLLPTLTPLGDVDEDEILLGAWGAEEAASALAVADIPPAIGSLRRRLLLTRLILADKARGATPDQAARLAGELARLIDQAHTERLDFARLKDLVPDDFAEHWRITLDFLKIVTESWPKVLAEEGALDPAERRNRLLEAQAAAWRQQPPIHPIIAAGSTGTIPATADLLDVVARLPRGAVVLPGLDRDADDATWGHIEPSHPQYGMARLLERLGVERTDVRDWPAAPGGHAVPTMRAALINQALRPADAGRGEARLDLRALGGVTRIEAAGPHEEAGMIALVLRQALENEAATAALVTPDRTLARRVAAELARWNIAVDDSAGQPLGETPPGAFLRLGARMVAEAFAPVELLAVLKHPLAAGGLKPAHFRTLARRLEIAVLRGPRPGLGIPGLRAILPLTDEDLLTFATRLERISAPFVRLFKRPAVLFRDLLSTHVAMAEALAATDEQTGAERLWAGEAGEAAAAFVAELHEAARDLPSIAGDAYPALLESLLAGLVVRPRYGRHPRLHIWGLLEARLQHADVLVLGGLIEGAWPPEARPSPWMSRPMTERFGLPPPERRIGLTAHDFAQAFSAPTVVLTRARRVEGTPTVPSRWLLRLENLVKGTDLEPCFADSGTWRHWQASLDTPTATLVPIRPAPKPPVEARPRKLSVTQIETWMRDPYSIYARHVLKLEALDPIDADPGAADYGNFIHSALDEFIKTVPAPAPLPDDSYERLLALGRQAFGAALDRPGVWAFWWPRFERVARWFLAVEATRRATLIASASETNGSLCIDGPAGRFELTAKADRIDRCRDGTLVLIDYKTGPLPTSPEVAAGFAPQLPLEALIAEAGGFVDMPKATVATLEYWRLKGADPAGERRVVGDDPRPLIDAARAGLQALITAFDRPETPYEARPRPDKAPRFSDYEHLARVKEWASGLGEDGP